MWFTLLHFLEHPASGKLCRIKQNANCSWFVSVTGPYARGVRGVRTNPPPPRSRRRSAFFFFFFFFLFGWQNLERALVCVRKTAAIFPTKWVEFENPQPTNVCFDWEMYGKWKSLRLDLLEVDRMTALIHYERQRWKKVNFFAKKTFHRSLFQHVQTLCTLSFIDLHTHATPGHVTSFACSRNTSDRSLAYCSHHGRRSARAIDRDRGETWNTSGKPHAVACCTSRSTASTGSRSTGMQ